MKTFLFVVLLLISKLAIAQSDISLSGILKHKDGSTAHNITVSLIRSRDSVVVKSLRTSKDGQYLFSDVRPDAYTLTFTSLSSQKVIHGPITIKKESLVLDTIYLDLRSEQLEEVNIVGAPPIIQKSIDRTTINVEHTSLAVGNTALDILNRAPGITVLNDGTIQINGKQRVTVMLDGKLTYLSSSQLSNLLRSTNSSQIKSIEIITRPPVKYDAAGSGGLINIKLIKSKEYGSNGTITADVGYGKYVKANTGILLNHRNKHLNVYGNYNYADNKRYGILNLDRDVSVPENRSKIVQQSNSTTMNHNHTYKAGVDYDINDNNVIGFIVSGYTNDQAEAIKNRSFIKNIATDPFVIQANNTAKNRYSNVSYNINYKSTLDTLGQQIDFDIALLNNKNAEYALYENNFFSDNGNQSLMPVIFRNISPTSLNISAFTFNYTLPNSKTLTVEVGIKSSLVKTDNDFLVENRKENSWSEDLAQSNRFLYKEHINAAYLNIDKNWKNFKLQLGVRGEHTSTDGISTTMHDQFKRKYLDLFPVISISKKINKNNTTSIIANRRIDRPNYGALNPFIYYLDLYTYKRGNQSLKPQYTNSLSFHYLLKEKFGLEAVYSHTKNGISDIIKPDTVRKALFTTPENLARQKSLSLSINAPFSISRFWDIYNDLSIYHVEFYADDIFGSTYKSGHDAMLFKSYSTFKWSKRVSFDLSFNYQSKQLYGTSYLRPFSFIDAGTSFRFLDNRLNAKVSVKDIFNQKAQIIHSNLPLVKYVMYDKPETRLIALGLSYSFGAKEVKQARRRSNGIEEEKGRIGGLR